MSDPAPKDESVEDAIRALSIGGGDRRIAILANVCFVGMGGCGRAVTEADFASDVERAEYRISGLCGPCQRIAFAPPPDED